MTTTLYGWTPLSAGKVRDIYAPDEAVVGPAPQTATPAGRRAIAELAACSRAKGKVTADMIMLLVLNNSALTLLPTTVLTLRAAAGSADAASILPASLAASAVSTVTAVILGVIFR